MSVDVHEVSDKKLKELSGNRSHVIWHSHIKDISR